MGQHTLYVYKCNEKKKIDDFMLSHLKFINWKRMEMETEMGDGFWCGQSCARVDFWQNADCFLNFCWQLLFFFSFSFIQFISFNFCVRFFFLVFRDCFTCPVTRKPHILFKFNFTQGMTEFTTRYGKNRNEKKKTFYFIFIFLYVQKDAPLSKRSSAPENNNVLDQVKNKLM